MWTYAALNWCLRDPTALTHCLPPGRGALALCLGGVDAAMLPRSSMPLLLAAAVAALAQLPQVLVVPPLMVASGGAAPPSPLIGAWYFGGWFLEEPYSHFHGFTPRGVATNNFFPYYPERVPLLGLYSDREATIAAEVHAADAAGLDFFHVRIGARRRSAQGMAKLHL